MGEAVAMLDDKSSAKTIVRNDGTIVFAPTFQQQFGDILGGDTQDCEITNDVRSFIADNLVLKSVSKIVVALGWVSPISRSNAWSLIGLYIAVFWTFGYRPATMPIDVEVGDGLGRTEWEIEKTM